ncbi:efflux RND transporter permease subunit [Alteromonas macleodii]|uniref:Heavy metal efflux pump, CzcA family protein n=1 Tax=Alteromonas macleodii TaxID=28108 RepID=A0AB36FMN8_ALTMA|nr:CusA/CzcA family heavy metal efflux RND transporter [Alteromonas macleodii]OES24443.1 heavy metal efflux pump, CzcA family protein [Alteromonas macleodii]OES25500.1 heavy metal efflux pump, CzcA family protein [Alteromonas macleodii]OES25802.1 heavy metal efflux pump, CzcA family protein [Alteromonas macleodii]OES38678.1 heavy metal efflux pump, CzcA family protein [Alteromonas macleodii]
MVSQSNRENLNTPEGPVAKLIGYCANHPGIVIILVLIMAVWGYRSVFQAPLDAIPDLSDAQVIVYTEWKGRSPDLVEDQITYPLTTALLSVPNVRFVRGQSFLGASFVYVIFEDGTDIYWARSRVLEYLNTVASDLPPDVQPTLGPDATGVGWVFQYALVDKTGTLDLSELRALQDFKLRYWLSAIDGVAEVASIGGFVKEYQVQIDPNRLASFGIELPKVVNAIRRSNNDIGGRVLEIAGHEHFVRGRGYIESKNDLKKVVIGVDEQHVPITLAQVADITLGPAMQRGLAELDGEGQTVGGIVVMRYGENALTVIERVKQRLQEVQSGLPDGVEVVITYDRSDLILRAINTLRNTLIEEMIVVSLIIIAFLLHVRSALVACITLPIAILLSFIPMSFQGLTANIMSLGGIAVAIGAMVDAAVVMMDNVHKKLSQGKGGSDRKSIMIQAMKDVGPSIFFSLVIITISFVPVFSLEATEGRLFKPLAYTKTYSMAFAAILSVTLIPALTVLLVKGKIHSERNPVNRVLIAIFLPAIRFCLRFRWPVVGVSLLALILTFPVARQLGNEFMPPLNEGSILYMPTALPGMSITEAGKVLQSMDAELMKFPEVERVFGKIGRSDSATDPAPLSMVETVITLKPKDQWREGLTWDDLISEMDEKLRYPGMPNIWWMPIQTRTEMLATGIRSTLGIKVFGDDLKEIEDLAVSIEKTLQEDPSTSPYTRSAFAERLTGGYFLDFDINREAASRYGLNVQDIEDVIMAAVGGIPATQTIEGRERYDVIVRYARDYRDSVDKLEQVLVPTRTGVQVPITEVADVNFRTGAPMIRNEDGQLVGFVFVDIKGDIGVADYVNLAKKAVGDNVTLPAGYRLGWAGQFQYFERAKAKLQWVVPATLLAIFLLLYLHRGRMSDTLFVLTAMPFSLMGSIWLLYLLNFKLSVAVWVGMIAMAGLAAEMGLLMLHYLDQSYNEHLSEKSNTQTFLEKVATGASQRIRPMLMTSLTLLVSLVPVMMSDGTGADVMKRIAAPMVGGTATALIVVLLVFPAMFVLWKAPALSREVQKGENTVK